MSNATLTAQGKPTKRIILLLDGTWNDQDFGETDTNIVRIQKRITAALERRRATHSTTQEKPAASLDDGTGIPNLIFYERGVGTSYRHRFLGGAFGSDLPDKVRNAYKFLSFHYEPGAQIFIFGFSRGAYTARSVIGMVHAAGLLRANDCTPANEAMAWHYYRTPTNARYPGIWHSLTPYVHSRDQLQISCVGVFDTVGALGIPLEGLKVLNRDRYQFHSVELSSITRLNLHAIAIDEHRKPFEAAIWRKPKFKQFASVTEQVWFPGVHSDIGGSYIPEVRRHQDNPCALDDITLDWMLRRVRARYPDFPVDIPPRHYDKNWSLAERHESRRGVYKRFPLTRRSIGNYPTGGIGWREYNGCYDRHSASIGEKVHISAFERLGARVLTDGRPTQYMPANLIDVLPIIRATYRAPNSPSLSGSEIRIVLWSGRELNPLRSSHCKVALALVQTALDRMK